MQEGEDERRHRLAGHALCGCGGEALFDQRLDVQGAHRRLADQKSASAELPVSLCDAGCLLRGLDSGRDRWPAGGGVEERELVGAVAEDRDRSEEHTSELQSLTNLVCRL